jgi:hypothetical protein
MRLPQKFVFCFPLRSQRNTKYYESISIYLLIFAALWEILLLIQPHFYDNNAIKL